MNLKKIKIKKRHKQLIKYGTFLMVISFLFTAISIFIVASNPNSNANWIQGLIYYTLGWALLLTGGFITGRYSFGYIIKYFRGKTK